MNLIKSISRLKLCVALILLIPLNTLSQTDTICSLPEADTSDPVYKISRHSLFSGIGLGSNLIYMGSTISRNQPFGYTALTYGFNNEFFATVSAIHLSEFNPFIAFYTGSLNYNHVFNSWFDISSGIYRYQVTPSSADTLFSNFTYGDLTLGIDWKLIYSKISVGGLISDESSGYFQIKNSRYFQTSEFMKNNVYLSFDPYVNLLLGTLIKAETTTGMTVTNSPPYANGKWWLNSNRAINTTYTRIFGVMGIDFGLPVALNFERATIEAEAGYFLPTYNNPEFPGPKGFVFQLSGYFRIF